jgi:hypothetical protein
LKSPRNLKGWRLFPKLWGKEYLPIQGSLNPSREISVT